jgi:hypothetical protein
VVVDRPLARFLERHSQILETIQYRIVDLGKHGSDDTGSIDLASQHQFGRDRQRK